MNENSETMKLKKVQRGLIMKTLGHWCNLLHRALKNYWLELLIGSHWPKLDSPVRVHFKGLIKTRSAIGLASPRVSSSPRVTSLWVQKVGLVPALLCREKWISYSIIWICPSVCPFVCLSSTPWFVDRLRPNSVGRSGMVQLTIQIKIAQSYNHLIFLCLFVLYLLWYIKLFYAILSYYNLSSVCAGESQGGTPLARR